MKQVDLWGPTICAAKGTTRLLYYNWTNCERRPIGFLLGSQREWSNNRMESMGFASLSSQVCSCYQKWHFWLVSIAFWTVRGLSGTPMWTLVSYGEIENKSVRNIYFTTTAYNTRRVKKFFSYKKIERLFFTPSFCSEGGDKNIELLSCHSVTHFRQLEDNKVYRLRD